MNIYEKGIDQNWSATLVKDTQNKTKKMMIKSADKSNKFPPKKAKCSDVKIMNARWAKNKKTGKK